MWQPNAVCSVHETPVARNQKPSLHGLLAPNRSPNSPSLCPKLLRLFETLVAEEMGKNACVHLQNRITSQTCKHHTMSQDVSGISCPCEIHTRDGDKRDLLQPVPPVHASTQTSHTEQVEPHSGQDCGTAARTLMKMQLQCEHIRTFSRHAVNRDYMFTQTGSAMAHLPQLLHLAVTGWELVCSSCLPPTPRSSVRNTHHL